MVPPVLVKRITPPGPVGKRVHPRAIFAIRFAIGKFEGSATVTLDIASARVALRLAGPYGALFPAARAAHLRPSRPSYRPWVRSSQNR